MPPTAEYNFRRLGQLHCSRIRKESEGNLSAGDKDANGSFAVERALEFANAATDALIPINVRQLHGYSRSVELCEVTLFQIDRFFWQRAHFFTDNAVALIGPRNAAILIDVRFADHLRAFVGQAQRRNRLHGTDLPA